MNWEMATGIATTVIAICALFLSIWQGIQMRRHNRISVLPHLTTWAHTGHNENTYIVQLINNGIGSAFIKSFKVEVDQKEIKGDGSERIKKALKILFPGYEYDSHQSFVDDGYAIAEKEKIPLAVVKFKGENRPSPEEIDHAINRAAIVVVYESAYGERFVLKTEEKPNKALHPVP